MTLKLLLPKLVEIIEHHRNGTRFGIGMDPKMRCCARGSKDISSHGWTPRWATGW